MTAYDYYCTSALTIRAKSRVASSLAHNPSNMPPIASSSARNLELSPIASDTAHSPTTSRRLRAGPLAIGAVTVWIVRRPPRRAHSQALAAGAIGSTLCAPLLAQISPWIFGTICERSRS